MQNQVKVKTHDIHRIDRQQSADSDNNNKHNVFELSAISTEFKQNTNITKLKTTEYHQHMARLFDCVLDPNK